MGVGEWRGAWCLGHSGVQPAHAESYITRHIRNVGRQGVNIQKQQLALMLGVDCAAYASEI